MDFWIVALCATGWFFDIILSFIIMEKENVEVGYVIYFSKYHKSWSSRGNALPEVLR